MCNYILPETVIVIISKNSKASIKQSKISKFPPEHYIHKHHGKYLDLPTLVIREKTIYYNRKPGYPHSIRSLHKEYKIFVIKYFTFCLSNNPTTNSVLPKLQHQQPASPYCLHKASTECYPH